MWDSGIKAKCMVAASSLMKMAIKKKENGKTGKGSKPNQALSLRKLHHNNDKSCFYFTLLKLRGFRNVK
jgi:hypothetical protein